MKLSEQRPLLRISPVPIAICETFPAKLHMLWFNFMALGLKVYFGANFSEIVYDLLLCGICLFVQCP